MTLALVRRPTEDAAIGAVLSSARPLPPLPVILHALNIARRLQDRAGARLLSHLVVRSATPEGGE